jgi:hypothetical protein
MGLSPVPAQLLTDAASLPARFARRPDDCRRGRDATEHCRSLKWGNGGVLENGRILTRDRTFRCWMARQKQAGLIRLNLNRLSIFL